MKLRIILWRDRRPASLGLAAAVLAVLLAFSGCGGEATDESAESPTKASQAEPPPSSDSEHEGDAAHSEPEPAVKDARPDEYRFIAEIVEVINAADLDTLRSMTSDRVFRDIECEIENAQQEGKRLQVTMVPLSVQDSADGRIVRVDFSAALDGETVESEKLVLQVVKAGEAFRLESLEVEGQDGDGPDDPSPRAGERPGERPGPRPVPIDDDTPSPEPPPDAVDTADQAGADKAGFIESVDATAVGERMRKELTERIFPSRDFSGNSMTLDLDRYELPNAPFSAECRYHVVKVLTRDGRNVTGDGINETVTKAYGGVLHGGWINVPIAQGTEAGDLGTATIRFRCELPTQLAVFHLTSRDVNRTIEKRGITVTLGRLGGKGLSGGLAGIGRRDSPPKVEILAFDDEGKPVKYQTYSASVHGFTGIFQDTIASAVLAVQLERGEVETTVDVDLNGGKKLTVPREPTDGVPARFGFHGDDVPPYATTTDADLERVRAEWVAAGNGRPERIQVELPPSALGAKCLWGLRWFGAREPVFVAGHAGSDGTTHYWSAADGEQGLSAAHAVIGAVRVAFPTDIQHVDVTRSSDGAWIEQPGPGGSPVRIRFDKQVVTYSTGGARLLSWRVYDAQGRPLKMDRRSPGDGERTDWYWGYPQRVSMVLSHGDVDKTIPIEIVRGEVDQDAFARFKAEKDDRPAVMQALATIGRAVQMNYGRYDDIAGLHFFHNNEGEPQAAIPRELALACPDSQERFGFELQPYHGYYFGFIDKFEREGKPVPCGRAEREVERTWADGKLTIKPFTEHPRLTAWPVDPKRPTLILSYSNILAKVTNGRKPDVCPASPYESGWSSWPVLHDRPLLDPVH